MQRRILLVAVANTMVTVIAINVAIGADASGLPLILTNNPWKTLAVSLVLMVVATATFHLVQRRDDEELATMVPAGLRPEPWVVDRPAEVERIVRALRRRSGSGRASVVVNVGVQGAGGFGKSTIARLVINDRRVLRRFRGRIYWVTLGREARGAALVEKVNDLARLIDPGTPYPFADLRQATDHLAEVLVRGPERLLILDDVWFEDQVTAFPDVPGSSRLITTRVSSLAMNGQAVVAVDQLSDHQARRLLTAGLTQPPPADLVTDLVAASGKWPLLLRLMNRALVSASRIDPDLGGAARNLVERLRQGDPTALDPLVMGLDIGDPSARSRSVSATIEASIGLLEPESRARFSELAVFVEDEPIPVWLVSLLWHATATLTERDTRLLCVRLADLALIDLTPTSHGGEATLHDVVRDYLRHRLGHGEVQRLNGVLVDAATDGLPSAAGNGSTEAVAWWELPASKPYLRQHLIEHLLAAGRAAEAESVATDIRWLEMRLDRDGPLGPDQDLIVVGTPLALSLRRSLTERRRRDGPSALTAFVEELHTTDRADSRPPADGDHLADLLRTAQGVNATARLQATAGAHFAMAARLVASSAEHTAHRHRFAALLALALAMHGNSTESTHDLCLAALEELDPGDADETEVRFVMLAYLGRRPGESAAESLGEALSELVRASGPGGFEQVVPLIATSETAARIIFDTVRGDPRLSAYANRFLRSGGGSAESAAVRWTKIIERWRRDRRKLHYQLGILGRLMLAPEPLQEADELLSEYRATLAATPELDDLAEAIRLLRTAQNEWRFDDKDAALRKAVRLAEAVQAEVRAAPTTLGVELADRAAARITVLAEQARQQLAASYPPKPEITSALPSARTRDGTVTVQIRVGNAEGRAPLESASLSVTAEPPGLAVPAEPVTLSGSLRGGEAETVMINLGDGPRSCPETIGVEVTLRYGPATEILGERLSIPVDHDFQPVRPNPYAAWAQGRPVDDPRMFFGRDDLLTRIREQLRSATSPGAGIAIVGRKRTGKSTIRLHLRRLLTGEDGLPVVDLGNLGTLAPQRSTTGQSLLGVLLWRILDGAAVPLPAGFDRQSLISSPDPVGDCGLIVEDHRRDRPGLPPWVVLIDEFQYLEQWIRDGLIPASLLHAFKAIIERQLFHFVLVGQSELERLIRADPNTFGVFDIQRVTYLADDDARALIQEPIPLSSGATRYHGRAAGEILRLTGGSPYYIQRLCSELVKYMNAQHAAVVTEADVARVTESWMASLTAADFDGLEPEEDRAAARRLLGAVSAASRGAPATLREIKYAHDGDVPQELFDDLVSRDVIRHEAGGYRIVVGLYEAWLERYLGSHERS